MVFRILGFFVPALDVNASAAGRRSDFASAFHLVGLLAFEVEVVDESRFDAAVVWIHSCCVSLSGTAFLSL